MNEVGQDIVERKSGKGDTGPSPEMIRRSNEVPVIRWLAEKLVDREFRPSLEQAKAAIQRSSMKHGGLEWDRQPLSEAERLRLSHWGKELEDEWDNIFDDDHPIFGEMSYADQDDSEPMDKVAAEMAARLRGTREGIVLANWIFDEFQDLAGNDWFMPAFLVRTALVEVDPRMEEVSLLGDRIWRLITSVRETKDGEYEFMFKENQRVKLSASDRDEVMSDLLINEVCGNLLLRKAAASGKEEREKIWRRLVDGGIERIPGHFNMVRRMIEDPRLAKEKSDLEELLRWQMGKIIGEDAPVYTNLQRLYEQFNIGRYDKVMSAQERAEMLDVLFKELGILRVVDSMAEFGAGTGELTEALANMGYRCSGLDASRANVHSYTQRTRRKFGRTMTARSWEHTGYLGKSLKAVISLGRSFSHTETRGGLYKVFKEARRVIDDGGYLIYDAEDPFTGSRGEARKRYEEYVRNVLGWEDEDYLPYVVDSPDGKNYYNRLVQSEEDHLEMLINTGFVPERVMREDIPGEGGNVNMVFVARRMTEKEYNELAYGQGRGAKRESIKAGVTRIDQTRQQMSGKSGDGQ